MKTGIHTATGAALLALLTLAACGPKSAGQPGTGGPGGAAMPPPEVEVMTVARGSVVLTQDLPGRLRAYRTSQVRARVDGIVEQRKFVEGSDVKAGAALFQIDARNYQTAYDAAKADAALARATADRYKSLLESRSVSQQDYDLAEARVKQAEAALARAQLDLDNTHVPAPIAGHIGRAQVTEGALVGHGDATLLATIEQIDTLYADFTQPGADVLHLQQALKSGRMKHAGTAKVELVLEDGSIYPLPGKLLFSDLAVDPGTGSVSMRAEIPNPRHELLPGMFVTIRFPQGSADDSIKVPQRAVQIGQQGQFVMTIDAESKAAPRPVKTAGMAGSDFVIADGLKVGDQVVVNGLQKARPGTAVKPVPLGGAPVSAPAAPEK
ncbi:MAG: efflux RND transporter periplasmic adaptor subunit [Nitrosomonadales bacterium]|nr:efflux RND transporter periplasmic adaptor subunit [Nitrosomonadales bacterium]